MKLHHLLVLFAVGTTPAMGGYVYISDFSGSNPGDPLQTIAQFNADTPGVDGWKQSEANPISDGSPLTWVTTHAGSTAGAIGTWYDIPAGNDFNANRAINESLAGSTLSLDFGIVGSTAAWPERNDFSITVGNSTGAGLFKLDFKNVSTSQWDMTWSSSTGQSSGTSFAGVLAGGAYNYTVAFTQNGTDIDAAFSISGGLNDYSSTTTLTGLAGETFSDLVIGMDMGSGTDWGDNSFSFIGVPEPGAALLLALSAVALLRRRR